jgi:hypothetical protein
MKSKFVALISLIAGFVLSAETAMAATCKVNGEVVPCGSFPWWIFIVIPIIGILIFVFWLKMLIHAAKSTNPGKVGWIILIVLTQFLGAVIYYFVVKRKEVVSIQ